MADSNSAPTKIANPAPLGLLGFGMTTVLLSLHNAGITPLDNVVLAMGAFCGGLAQLIAGIFEYRNGNTFGMVAFTMYGVFWMSFVGINTDAFGMGSEGTTAGAYCLVWGIMTLFMFLGTLKGRISSQFVFFTLTVTFFLLAVADIGGFDVVKDVAGVVGLICGSAAIYSAAAEVLEAQHGKEVLPY